MAQSPQDEKASFEFAQRLFDDASYANAAQEFRQFIKDGVDKIEELSTEFQVSTIALRIRAKNLGMSGHGL